MKPVPNQMPARDPGSFRLALIGEAPGADEVAQGRPFAGASGWLLDQWLSSCGVSRPQVFVGNVSQMRPSPSSNDFNLLEWNGPEIQAGIAALRTDLAAFRPSCVLAMGNAALHLLRHGNVAPPKSRLGYFQWPSKVGTWRGSLFLAARLLDMFDSADLRRYEQTRYESMPPTFSTWKALGTYHPAATFRDPSFTYPLVSDLRRAVSEAHSPSLVLPVRNIAFNLSFAEIERRCEALRVSRQPVGFDIEGGLGGLQCLSFATTPHDAFVIDLMESCLERAATMRAIAGVLEDDWVPKVCWNAAYERAILQAVAAITLRGYEDGMIAWWERFSELPKSLDFVASLLTKEPYWAEGIGWDKKTGAPKVRGERFWRYNGIDSCVTLEIWQHPTIKSVVEARQAVPFETSSIP